jgi:hypothetical protein
MWWVERQAIYPRLSRMARDYLSIPGKFILIFEENTSLNTTLATSVDVERIFSKGCLLLSHVRNRLSVDSTRALLCLGNWANHGMIKSEDIKEVAKLPDVRGGKAKQEA